MKHSSILTGIIALSLLTGHLFAGNTDNTVVPADNQTTSLPAPTPLLYKTGASSYYSSLLLRFGFMSCDFTGLNSGSTYSGKAFSDMPLFGGVSFTLPLQVRKVGAFDICAEYNFIMPQTLTYATNVSNRLSGFTGAIGIGTDVFPKNTGFDLIISAGLWGGRFKLKDLAGSAERDYTKNMFGPQILVYPRLVLKAISIGLRASYRFDFLSPNFIASDSNPVVPGPVIARGYSIEAVIGIILGRGKR
jgi:hypothetical protein